MIGSYRKVKSRSKKKIFFENARRSPDQKFGRKAVGNNKKSYVEKSSQKNGTHFPRLTRARVPEIKTKDRLRQTAKAEVAKARSRYFWEFYKQEINS